MLTDFLSGIRFRRLEYIPFYAFLLVFSLITFGSVVGYHFKLVPLYLLISTLCIYKYKDSGINTPALLSPILAMSILAFLFSINFVYFTNVQYNYVQYVSYSLIPVLTTFVFYRFSCKGENENRIILLFFLLFFVVGIYRFFHAQDLLMDLQNKQNNYFYQVLMPLPILLLYRNKTLRLIFLLVVLFICVLSIKRSAAIGISAIIIIYLLNDVLLNKNKWRIIFISLLIMFLAFHFYDFTDLLSSFDRLTTRMDRLEEDGGSGRLDVIKRFFESDIFDGYILLGKGVRGYSNKYPEFLASHNDLIETYYSLGILGLIAYIKFIYRLGREAIIKTISRVYESTAYLSAFVILIIYIFAGGVFSFVELCIPFFAFIGISQSINISSSEH